MVIHCSSIGQILIDIYNLSMALVVQKLTIDNGHGTMYQGQLMSFTPNILNKVDSSSLKTGSGFYSSTVDQCTDRLATKPHLERDRVPFCTLILFDYFRSLFSIFLDHDSFLGLLIYTLSVYE